MLCRLKPKYWLGIFWWLPALGLAADTPTPTAGVGANVETATAAADTRPALFPESESLSSDIGTSAAAAGPPTLDSYQWLDTANKRGLLVARQAFGPEAMGVVLIVTAGLGAHGAATFAGQPRTSLPAADWHTYLQSVPRPPTEQVPGAIAEWHNQVSERVRDALALIKQTHASLPQVVIAEGQVCVPLAGLTTLAASGLVLLNQPLPKGLAGLAQVTQPTLLLQILPNRIKPSYPLAAAVDVRQLPRVSPRQPKSLLLRQVRGWLRQFEGAANAAAESAATTPAAVPPLPS